MVYRKKRFSKKFKRRRKVLATKYDRIQDGRIAKLSKFIFKTIERRQITQVNDLQNQNENRIRDDGWSFTELTRMPAGSGARNDERTGNLITIGSLQFKLMIEDFQPNLVGRLIIAQFPNLTSTIGPAQVNQMLQYAETDATAVPPVLEQHIIISPYLPGSQLKFKVLKDITIKHTGNTPASPNGQTLVYKCNITKKDGLNPALSFDAAVPGAISGWKNNVIAYWRMTDMNLNVIGGQSKDVVFVKRMTYRDS